MKTKADIEILEKTIGQLHAVHQEMSLLSRKSPNDGVNSFKLRVVNGTIQSANKILGHSYVPIEGFDSFDEDNLPSTSDVVLVVAQYLREIQRFQQDNTVRGHDYKKVYLLDGKPTNIIEDPSLREWSE